MSLTLRDYYFAMTPLRFRRHYATSLLPLMITTRFDDITPLNIFIITLPLLFATLPPPFIFAYADIFAAAPFSPACQRMR